MPGRVLLTGRAGSGKTWSVLARVEEMIRARREQECLLFLPTRSQVDHLKGLLLRRGIRGFRDDFAHTFFSFARSLVPESPERFLSEVGREFLIAEVLERGTLPAFEAVRSTLGFRELLGRALKELKENGISPEEYGRRILQPLKRGGTLAARHRDLGAAYAGYQQLLKTRGKLDSEDLALGALERLEKDPRLGTDRRLLLVDGFHDFTPVQFRILARLIERIPESHFTVSFESSVPGHPVFAVSAGTRRALLALGFREEPLAGNRRTPDPTLQHLERAVFGESLEPREAGESIRITRASRMEDEIEGIARAILRLVREEKVPYRDIAVLFHHLEEVGDFVEGVFQRFGIPARLYRPRPLDRQPVVRFLLDLGRLIGRGLDPDTTLRFLRSGYVASLDPAEVDSLDLLLRERRPPATEGEWAAISRKDDLPGLRRVLEILLPARRRAEGHLPAARAVRAWLDAFQALAVPEGQPEIVPFGESGPRGAEECAGAEEFRRLLEEAAGAATREKPAPAFASLLSIVEAGAAGAEFRVRDRRREVVNVINAYEARQWEVPYLFVAGILERQFPPAPLEDLFFSDADRKHLDGSGLRFPGRQWRQDEERYLFYTALTRARRQVHLSHPVHDSQGNPRLASFFIREVERLFTPESLGLRAVQRAPSAVLPAPDEIVLDEEVDRAIFLGLEDRFPGGAISRPAALAAALHQIRIADPAFQHRLAAARAEPKPSLTEGAIRDEMAAAELAFSNSRLTDFLQCPYLHFTRKWLRLEELPSRDIEFGDLGTVLHETLSEYFAKKGTEEASLILDRRYQDLAGRKRSTFGGRTHLWRLRRALEAFLRDESRRREERGLEPARFEISFGTKQAASVPAVLLTVDGREEHLSGQIDRIDQSRDGKVGLVVDYKYSQPDGVKDRWQANLSDEEISDFQLALYLRALREAFEIEPAGAEFVALRGTIERMGILRERFAESVRLPSAGEKRWKRLDEEAFRQFLAAARERMATLIRGIRSAEIVTRPRDQEACGPGSCPAADLCRFDLWAGKQGRSSGE